MPPQSFKHGAVTMDMEAYGSQLRKRLRSREGKEELVRIRRCSEAARKKFERAEILDTQLMKKPMT